MTIRIWSLSATTNITKPSGMVAMKRIPLGLEDEEKSQEREESQYIKCCSKRTQCVAFQLKWHKTAQGCFIIPIAGSASFHSPLCNLFHTATEREREFNSRSNNVLLSTRYKTARERQTVGDNGEKPDAPRRSNEMVVVVVCWALPRMSTKEENKGNGSSSSVAFGVSSVCKVCVCREATFH